jgi:hypothetical protein
MTNRVGGSNLRAVSSQGGSEPCVKNSLPPENNQTSSFLYGNLRNKTEWLIINNPYFPPYKGRSFVPPHLMSLPQLIYGISQQIL